MVGAGTGPAVTREKYIHEMGGSPSRKSSFLVDGWSPALGKKRGLSLQYDRPEGVPPTMRLRPRRGHFDNSALVVGEEGKVSQIQ